MCGAAAVFIFPCLPPIQSKHKPLKSYPFHSATDFGRKQSRLSAAAVGRTYVGVQNDVVEDFKRQLLTTIQDTQRGFVTTADQRSSIEEALVTVECFDAGDPLNLLELDGTWRLQYTSAPDVLVLLDAASRLNQQCF